MSSSVCAQEDDPSSLSIGPQPKSNFVVRVYKETEVSIYVNEEKGPITLGSEQSFELTVELSGSSGSRPVDYWILHYASIPNAWHSFVYRNGTFEWREGFHYCLQMPITDFKDIKIPNPPVSEHMNNYFFAVDNNSDGQLDGTFFDTAVMTCTCDPSDIVIN